MKNLDNIILDCDFVKEKASRPLRVCCYGSSSSRTPAKYLNESRNVGYILAKRGHTCVNGAGSFGCMAALNEGAELGNGHVVGVIHEMFLVDSADWGVVRDGGAHPIFDNNSKKTDGPVREMLVAGGSDLQERKRLLVDKADALIVLPGGPGTWDELWEMACARQIGLSKLPIVCVNVDGFYEPFRIMLERAGEDQLLQLEPSHIVHFERSAEDAVRWIEGTHLNDCIDVKPKKRSSALRRSSVLHDPTSGSAKSYFDTIYRWIGSSFKERYKWRLNNHYIIEGTAFFAAGLSLGILLGRRQQPQVSN